MTYLIVQFGTVRSQRGQGRMAISSFHTLRSPFPLFPAAPAILSPRLYKEKELFNSTSFSYTYAFSDILLYNH